MKVIFKQPTTIPVGLRLVLSPEQAAAREHALSASAQKKGKSLVYLVEKPVQFKAGETVEIYGDLPKGLLPIEPEPEAKTNDSVSDTAE